MLGVLVGVVFVVVGLGMIGPGEEEEEEEEKGEEEEEEEG